MLMTSALLFIAMREIWGWGLIASAAVAGVFLIVDSVFFLANMAKIAHGGYVPILLALAVYGVMWIWHRGAAAVRGFSQTRFPVAEFLAKVKATKTPRVPGTAVFISRTKRDTPPVMVWHVKKNRALHQKLFV